MPDPEVPANTLTPEESGKVAEALFNPVVNRIVIQLQALVQMTASGDYAIWAVLVAMDRVVAELDWASVSRDHAEHFAYLAELVFDRCSTRMADYRVAIAAWQEGTPFPALTPWGNDDTVYVLAIVDGYKKTAPPSSDVPDEGAPNDAD